MVGRAARLGLGACGRGFGLVGVLDELRGLEPASTLGSALAFFSGVPKPKRFSGTPGCGLGTKIKTGTESTLYEQDQRRKKLITGSEEGSCSRLPRPLPLMSPRGYSEQNMLFYVLFESTHAGGRRQCFAGKQRTWWYPSHHS